MHKLSPGKYYKNCPLNNIMDISPQMAQGMILVFLTFGFFAVFHSFTASTRFKKAMGRVLVEKYPYYRLLYTFLSFITFLPFLIAYVYHMKFFADLYSFHGVIKYLFLAVQISAGLGLLVTLFKTDFYKFIGIKIKKKQEKERLVTGGIYGIVRHPLYALAILFLIFKNPMSLLDAFSIFLFILYFISGAILEERKLIEKFGDEYIVYKSKVPMFIPLGRRGN